MTNLQAFDMYFAAIVSMSVHPGFNKPDTPRISIQDAADLALEMLYYRNSILEDIS